MSKVPIRMPTGNPAQAFLSRPATSTAAAAPPPPTPPAANGEQRAPHLDTTVGLEPSAERAPLVPRQIPRLRQPAPAESQVRFQFYLPVSLAKLVDAEVERRKAIGRRGRGKSDYTTIFRELVEKHLR
jgi:hypothetical protein